MKLEKYSMKPHARANAEEEGTLLASGLISGEASVGDRAAAWLDHIEKHGVESWARWTMPGRLGSSCDADMMEGWAKLMG